MVGADGKLLEGELAGYAIIELIGEGGSATVYRAQKDDAVVALKVSHPHLAKHRDASARFLREVKAIQRASHPGIVSILDWGIADDRIYIAMELIEALDLSVVLEREGTFTEARAVWIASAVCEVLCAAHKLGVVHRDLKPRNIKLLSPRGGYERVKLMDFGLAKIFRPADAGEQAQGEELTHVETLTGPSTVLGTPKYMAPELYGGHENVDGRTDIYSLGVIMYRMLTGRTPHVGKDALQLMMSVATKTAPPLGGGIDPELEAIVMKCIEKNVTDRFTSAEELRKELLAIIDRLEESEQDKATRVFNPTPDAEADTQHDRTHVYRVKELDEDGEEPTRTKTVRLVDEPTEKLPERGRALDLPAWRWLPVWRWRIVAFVAFVALGLALAVALFQSSSAK